MTRRKFKTAKLDTKLMVDVAGASLIVQQVPALLQQWFKLDETISQVGAVGIAYLAGSFFNRPNISNAAIALFVMDMAMPLLSGILPGGIVPVQQLPVGVPGAVPTPAIKKPVHVFKKYPEYQAVDDFFSLNDYTNDPSSNQNHAMYRDSY